MCFSAWRVRGLEDARLAMGVEAPGVDIQVRRSEMLFLAPPATALASEADLAVGFFPDPLSLEPLFAVSRSVEPCLRQDQGSPASRWRVSRRIRPLYSGSSSSA